MKVKIYCLYDEVDCKIRYIGRTSKQVLNHRLIEHITKSKYYEVYYPDSSKIPHKVRWIKSLLNKGREPKIKLLTEIEGWKESHIFERSLINKYKDKFDLTNADDRGEGNKNRSITKEERLKISSTLKKRYNNNELKKTTKKVFIFNKHGEIIKEKNSVTELAKEIGISPRMLSKKIKTKKSYENMYFSFTNRINLEEVLYCYNINDKKYYIFDNIQDICFFLKIKRCKYKQLSFNNKEHNEFTINCNYIIKKVLISLIKENEIYNFYSYIEAAKTVNCDVSNIYKLVNGSRKSIFKFKLNK